MKRRDPLLLIGLGFILLVLLFAALGPWLRDRQLQRALGAPVSSVYSVVSQPNVPAGTEVTAVESLWLRGDGKGAVVTGVEPGTTAKSAGFSLGSVVTAVDGEAVAGKPLREIVERLSRNPATDVTVVRTQGGSDTTQSIHWERGRTPTRNGTVKLLAGTDEQGRDVVARLAQGARISLYVGIVVQLIALAVGVTVGVLGVFAPRWISMPLMRLTDGMFAFPDILLAILIIGVYQKPGLAPVIVALAITSWPSMARLVRAQTATLKDREFVIAAKAAGASTTYQVTRHILPQLFGLLLAVSMIEVAGTILAESTLSFLGIGVQAPDPSWGSMINNARSDMNSHPMLLLWPCLILSLTIFALNFVGDGLSSWFDPKGR